MKKTILLFALMVALPFSRALAQVGEIIYHDYEPDLMLQFMEQPTEIQIDFDEDGIYDIRMCWYFVSVEGGFKIVCHGQNVKVCKAEVGDTIPFLSGWYFEQTFATRHENYAVRIEKDEEYYYGWFRTYYEEEEQKWYLDERAYCTIPNYPLRWGQTDLYDDVEESGTNGFATVQPNPTAGLFTITGEGLKRIEICDALGQEIASLKANGNQTTIDLSSQPAGVYLVSVTDTEGRRCVKKVVKN